MKQLRARGTFSTLLFQQSGQIQLFIIAPILTLFFLSLVVRTASSAVDSSLEKKKVTQQLKRRLNQVRTETEEEVQSAPVAIVPAPAVPQKTTEVLLPVKAPAPRSPLKTTLTIKRRATLEKILIGEGVGPEEIQEWLKAAKKYKEFKNLRPGRPLTLSFVGDDLDQQLKILSYEIDNRTLLILEKISEDKIAFRREMLPVTLAWRAVGGQIKKNFYKDARKAGVPEHLVDDLADLDWDMEFSDLRSGDTFKVIFEEFLRDGKVLERGQIVAAEIVNRGKVFTAFPFPQEKGQRYGSSSSSRAFLRYPLQFTRISSVFTDARFHPILERVRPHRGVDFAAPRGTPVRSVAEGKVSFAGRRSGYGNMISIDHPGPYDTAYAHLERIAKGVKEGQKVQRGQVIGYVGSTGWATGPHLHFELHRDGEYINPLTAKLPVVADEKTQYRESPAFAAAKKRATEQLSALKVGSQPISLTLAAPKMPVDADTSEQKRLALVVAKPSSPAVSSARSKTPARSSSSRRAKRR
jgi:murein DD-endopeptidase MepM/ murein hydrolase activator NlpD